VSVPETSAVGREALTRAFVARLRRVAGSPEMAAIQQSLPRSFVGLAVGLVAFMLTRPGTLLLRFSGSFAAAFAIMSALLVVLLTDDLARRRNVPRALALAISTIAFALSLPYGKAGSIFELARALGSSGLFLALGIALATVGLLRLGRRRFGKTFGAAFAALCIDGGAATLVVLGFSLTTALAVVIAPLGNLGDSLTALLILTFIETALWTIGIHGPALLAAVVLPVYIHLQVQNTEALAHDRPLPHIVTVSLFLFVFPGGAGATLPLVLLLLRSKVKRVQRIAYATLLPSLVNANEPLMFGLPLVLNPVLGVPFIVVPLVLAFVSYEAIALGFVSRPAYYIPSMVPAPLGAFLATKDWRSVVLVFAEVALGLAIYAPFVAIYERQERRRSSASGAA
jgi:PTS system cellobiose-specific IIC component